MENECKDTKKSKLLELLFPSSDYIDVMTKFVVLITAIGSIITLSTSAYKANAYSRYYGVQIGNFDFLSTAKEMLVIIGPLACMLVVVRLCLSFLLDFKRLTDEKHASFAGAISCLAAIYLFAINSYIGIGASYVFDFIIESWIKFIIVMMFFLCVVYNYFEMIFNIKNNKVKTIFGVVKFITAILLLVLVLFSLFPFTQRMYEALNPRAIKTYETVSIDDTKYIIVCSSSKSKIALESEFNEEENSLLIHYGKYKIIKPEKYVFEYITFKSVDFKTDETIEQS